MKYRKTEKIVIAVTAVFIAVSVLLMFGRSILSNLYFINGTDLTIMPEATGTTDEIRSDTVIEQTFRCNVSSISKIGIVLTREKADIQGKISISLIENGNVLMSETYDATDINDQHRTFLEPDMILTSMKGKTLTLQISNAGNVDTGIRVMMSADKGPGFRFGNRNIKGTLCFSITE